MVQRNASIVELDHAEIRGYLTWHHPFEPFKSTCIHLQPERCRTGVLLGYFAARSIPKWAACCSGKFSRAGQNAASSLKT